MAWRTAGSSKRDASESKAVTSFVPVNGDTVSAVQVGVSPVFISVCLIALLASYIRPAPQHRAVHGSLQ
jgi:hypothetical protein